MVATVLASFQVMLEAVFSPYHQLVLQGDNFKVILIVKCTGQSITLEFSFSGTFRQEAWSAAAVTNVSIAK